MMGTVSIALGAVIGLCITGGTSAWVAAQKRREPAEGLILGFLLGPLGLLVEALLPTVEAPKPRPRRRSHGGYRFDAEPERRADPVEDQAAEWLGIVAPPEDDERRERSA